MSGAPSDSDHHTQPAFTPDEIVEPEALPGPQLGDYTIIRRIGQGGMGIVYEGVQPVIGKRVAIKVLKPHVAGDPVHVRRLLAEAQVVNAIGHRGIIDIFGFGELEDGRHYVVMEYLVGTSLDALIRGGKPLPPSMVVFILDEVLSALSAAHAKGVIHRDLKPSNIFLVSEASGNRYVKLLDFGLAKQLDPSHSGHTTRVVGTPAYMAPEQALGEKLEPRTDLYALGVVAFELLTGRLPFESDNFAEMMRRHVEEPPPRPSTLVPSIPPALEALVLQLLAKAPADRPSSAEVARNELKAVRRAMPEDTNVFAVGAFDADAPTASHRVDTADVPPEDRATPDENPTRQSITAAHRAADPLRRHPKAMLAGAGAFILLVGVAVWRASSTDPAPPAAVSSSPASAVAEAVSNPGGGEPPPTQSSAPLASSFAPPASPSSSPAPTPPKAEADSAQRMPSPLPAERLPPERKRPARALREAPRPPPKPAGTGILELVPTASTWAYVSIDGKGHKQCPELPPICELELEAGPHRIDVHGPNVKPASYTVRVQPGKRARLHIRLSPAR